MNGNASSDIQCPLFPTETDVWESLDEQTQQEIETLIARLLVWHVKRQLPQPNQAHNTKENRS
jgi:hypothetical protein